MNWITWFGGLFGFFAGVWVIFRYLIVITVRIDARSFKTIYELAKKDTRRFVLSEEFITEAKYPVEYKAICRFQHAPCFYLNHSERLLSGFMSKDSVTQITCFRWDYRKAKIYLSDSIRELQLKQLGITVEIIKTNYTDIIGILRSNPPIPALHPKYWEDIEKDAAAVFSGKKQKSGALIYGPPGNNKTFFVKYLACKYRVPIKIITLSPDFSNFDVMDIFSQITEGCIVLLEDFDNYFDGRKCVLGTHNKSVKFSFDTILAGLDGAYNSYERVFFILTVNDINKVDYALKNRPSRLKFVREFKCPELETRLKLLPKEWAENTEGFNLDQIFCLKEFHAEGLNFEESISNLGMSNIEERIREMAQLIYSERQLNKNSGDENSDWKEAKKKLGVV